MTPQVIALLGLLLGGGFLGAIVTFRKAGAESASIATKTLIAVNEELRRDLTRRDTELAILRERVAVLESKIQ